MMPHMSEGNSLSSTLEKVTKKQNENKVYVMTVFAKRNQSEISKGNFDIVIGWIV